MHRLSIEKMAKEASATRESIPREGRAIEYDARNNFYWKTDLSDSLTYDLETNTELVQARGSAPQRDSKFPAAFSSNPINAMKKPESGSGGVQKSKLTRQAKITGPF